MRRREFLTLACVTGAAATFPRLALAQQVRLPRVAIVAAPQDPARLDAFTRNLATQGYVAGDTVILEFFVAPTASALPAFAAQAVASRPDVIFTITTAAAVATKAATSTIPVVFLSVADPVGSGLVASLARPGGNFTGMSDQRTDYIPKEFTILKELVPSLTRIAVLNVPADPLAALYREPVEVAAKAIGIEPVFVDFVDSRDLATQFGPVMSANAQAVFVPAFAYWGGRNGNEALYDLLLANKLPALTSALGIGSMSADPVGVVGYGTDFFVQLARATTFVAAILKGAKPADLPVEQAREFVFKVNLDLARKIGLTVPHSILLQATQVIDYDVRAPR